MTELYPTSLHSEERGVATFLLWGLALNRNLESGTSDNLLLESDDFGRHVVTGGLEELSSRGPASLSVVAHPPGLAENLTAVDFVLVGEAFFDEACGVAQVLGLFSNWSLSLPGMRFINNNLRLWFLDWNVSISVILADELGRGLGRFADLEHGVVSMYAILLTGIAEVSVSTD